LSNQLDITEALTIESKRTHPNAICLERYSAVTLGPCTIQRFDDRRAEVPPIGTDEFYWRWKLDVKKVTITVGYVFCSFNEYQ
jgi:hypothetical protein